MRERDDARARAEQPQIGVEVDDALPVDRRDADLRAGLCREELPGHDVRVVLELRDDDLVARREPRAAMGLRDEVDRLGRPAHEHDLGDGGGVHEAPHLLARTLVERGRLLRQRVHAAVHVGMVRAGVPGHRVDHRGGLLGGRRIVEIGEGVAVDAAGEHGKVRADALDVERQGSFACGGHQPVTWINSFCGRAAATSDCAAARTAVTGRRPTRSWQKAKVSSARAASGSSPRETR